MLNPMTDLFARYGDRFKQYYSKSALVSYDAFLPELVNIAVENGYVKNNENIIYNKELSSLSKDICWSLRTYVESTADILLYPMIACSWAVFAGMGVLHMYNNKMIKKLDADYIVDSLVDPKGCDCMDEYVCDLLMIDHESEKFKTFNKFLGYISFPVTRIAESSNMDTYRKQLCEDMIAMFHLGMLIQESRT